MQRKYNVHIGKDINLMGKSIGLEKFPSELLLKILSCRSLAEDLLKTDFC